METHTRTNSKFNKTFSSMDILMIAFGAMIGWGWVVSTGDWIGTAGVVGAMLGFILGGVMIFFIGMAYAELTPAMPECGGEHVFSMRAMGPVGSFICTWAIILGYVSVVCFEACALPTIITYVWPQFLQGYLYTVAGFDIYATWLATAIVFAVFITVINIMGAKTAAKLQNILTLAIGAAGILLIVASVFTGNPSNLEGQMFAGSGMQGMMSTIIKVAAVSPFFFIGFDVIPQAAEEINVPLKKIGKILILSIVLGVGFYALVIFSVGYVMNGSQIAASYNGSGLVTADAMANAFHSTVMAKVLILAGMCGIITSWNSFMIGGSRAMYSMAESYMIPKFFGKLHPKTNTPYVSILVVGLLSVLAPFAGRKMLVWIVDAGNFGCILAYCMVSLSFIILHVKEPTLPRPYKVKHWKFIGTMAVLMSAIMIMLYILPGTGVTLAPQEWAMVAGWTLLGVVFFIFSKLVYKEKFGYYAQLAVSETDKAEAEGETAKPARAATAIMAAEASAPDEWSHGFDYFLPVNLVFGQGKVEQVGKIATAHGSTAMIVTGGNSVKRTGTYDRVRTLLENEGMNTVLFDKVTPNPLTTTVEEGAKLAVERHADVIIGLGGGSAMDAAKGIAFMARNDGRVTEYIYGEKTSSKALPLILVPTTFGTGSESNGFAVMTNPDNGDKKSLRSPALVATASIVDPDLMRSMPSGVIAANGCDMLCHCIEAFTANNAQPFTDALALYAIPLIANNIVSLYRGEGTDEQWSKVCLAGTIGGMVINTAGITLGHAMEHPVSGLKDVTHGKGLAAIEPTAIEATYRYNRFKFGRVARVLGGFTAEDCAPRMRTLLKDLDLDVTLTDLGITKKDIPWLAANAHKVSPGNLVNTPGSELVTTEESLERLYESML
ncbi:iron-containing alcohol dehydrogenase [Bifidobacterium sp. 64T4]|uniref:bifunctional amino acid transporter/iron-containing alcohol dehydrogenase n=1 Tax=Bifidobacterium pongonis TaxID=2834432 RepID=UPI001C584ED7|nr:bifunctional amino acid transporter/iron-containing alcohol dehydrogenase [Bifidobacterium pongonis]MBW3094535.1 iron-containing alcohol dehydrogenase [Bifidobacterium pongonis]